MGFSVTSGATNFDEYWYEGYEYRYEDYEYQYEEINIGIGEISSTTNSIAQIEVYHVVKQCLQHPPRGYPCSQVPNTLVVILQYRIHGLISAYAYFENCKEICA